MLELISVIIGAFIGATLSYYFTRWQFHKELLYKTKIEAYAELISLLLKFKSICNKSNNLNLIIKDFHNFISCLNSSFIFMPDSVYEFIIEQVGDPITEFGRISFEKQKFQQSQIPVDFIEQSDLDVADPEMVSILVDVFAPMLANVPGIVRKLKEDIGATKLGTKFVK